MMRSAMKRFGYLAVLMALSSSAHASGMSFVVHGQRVHIEAPRNCRSLQCLSVSVPGFHVHRDDDDDQAMPALAPVPAKPALAALPAAPAPPAPISPPPAPIATAPVAQPVPAAPAVPAVSTVGLAPVQAIPAPPKPQPVKTAVIEKPPVATAPEVPLVPPATTKATARAGHESDDLDGPLGDWQTAGDKGMVRIESCGSALCGHMLNPGSNARGETVLVNMKPNSGGAQWSGSIISRASGESYYATITMKGQDVARVEACAFGRLFCTGKDWTRIEPLQLQLRVSRQASAE